MGAFNYGNIVQMTLQEARSQYTGLLAGERFPVGTLGIVQDGRMFRFCFNGIGATTVPGSVYTGPVLVTNHVNNTATATAVGSRTVTFTQGATAVLQNQYKDGGLNIDVTPGGGYFYGLSSHDAVGSAAPYAWPLAPGETIQVALTTTSRISLVSNPYRNLVIAPTTTLAGAPAGVAVSAITVSTYGWLQVEGMASVLTDGTVIIGNFVMTPSTNTAGAVVAGGATEAVNNISVPIGKVLRASATTAFSAIDLTMLG